MSHHRYTVSPTGIVHRVYTSRPWGAFRQLREITAACVYGQGTVVKPEDIVTRRPAGRLCSHCFCLPRKRAKEGEGT